MMATNARCRPPVPHGEARKYFFFEKKKQKTFVLSVYASDTGMNKSFLVLFFKKELLFYRLPSFGGASLSSPPAAA